MIFEIKFKKKKLIFITQLLFRLDLEGISKSGQNPVKDWLEKPFF
jgi:hypothetical protein